MLKELQYPFDSNYIMSKKKRIKRDLLEKEVAYTEKRIAILGGSTTNDIKLVIELFLLNYGIRPSFYESEYNQFYEEAVFSNPVLEEFRPDVIYIHTTNRNITRYPTLDDTAQDVDSLLENEMEKYMSIWKCLKEKYHCPIIQNNFEMPFYRLLGNMDASDIHGKINFLTRLNLRFYEYAQVQDDFFICDINYISADYGLKEWSDPFYYYMYKYALNVNAIPYLAHNVANIIKSIYGKNKKGFVLDLDNTLWGGVIGDDGVENIVLGPETAEGQAYLEFQKYIKEYKQLGILLNINSKNDYENALKGIEHPNSELKIEDFIDIKANWSPKDMNFVEIANELNLLPESLVFIDDNPAERYIVAAGIDNVPAPELGEVQQYIQNIDRNGFFEPTRISSDDIKRNEMYKQNITRAKHQANFKDYDEYLISLEMKSKITKFQALDFGRIAQLSNKTNQFNLTTKRYTQSEIEDVASGENYITLCGRLSDKFGDNGVTSLIIGRKEASVCWVELWLMSCRVLKRNMEYAMMDALVKACLESGVNEIRGIYYPTEKNSMVKDFYYKMGFVKVNEENGSTEWKYVIPMQYEKKNHFIQVSYE